MVKTTVILNKNIAKKSILNLSFFKKKNNNKNDYSSPIIFSVIIMLVSLYIKDEEKSITHFIGIVIGVFVGALVSIPLVKWVFKLVNRD